MAVERPGRFFLLALAAALVLAAAERGARTFLAGREPGRGGSWIWARPAAGSGVTEAAQPVAFFAVRDVELAAADRASLEIAADEGYELYLNGRPVGAGSFRTGMAIDRYAVGDLLRAGRNRITVALRSARGAGGLLAALVADERTVAVTDGKWRIFRRQQQELFDPDAPLAVGEAPQIWQRGATGRWRPRPATEDRPRIFEQPGPPPNRFPIRARHFHPEASWQRLRRRQLRLPVRSPRVLLDWGSEVEGLLSFALISPPTPTGTEETPGAESALAYFGNEPPDPEDRPADEILVFAPGQGAWRDAHARRFRYVLLLGVPPLARVRVWKLDPATAAQLAPPPREPAGVFGLRPPNLRSAAERRVWERLGR